MDIVVAHPTNPFGWRRLRRRHRHRTAIGVYSAYRQ
jgi:hypothetical protein